MGRSTPRGPTTRFPLEPESMARPRSRHRPPGSLAPRGFASIARNTLVVTPLACFWNAFALPCCMPPCPYQELPHVAIHDPSAPPPPSPDNLITSATS